MCTAGCTRRTRRSRRSESGPRSRWTIPCWMRGGGRCRSCCASIRMPEATVRWVAGVRSVLRHLRTLSGRVPLGVDGTRHPADPDGSYAYGGDFGEELHDGTYVLDGLVFPDLAPQPVLEEVRKVYEPVRLSDLGRRPHDHQQVRRAGHLPPVTPLGRRRRGRGSCPRPPRPPGHPGRQSRRPWNCPPPALREPRALADNPRCTHRRHPLGPGRPRTRLHPSAPRAPRGDPMPRRAPRPQRRRVNRASRGLSTPHPLSPAHPTTGPPPAPGSAGRGAGSLGPGQFDERSGRLIGLERVGCGACSAGALAGAYSA